MSNTRIQMDVSQVLNDVNRRVIGINIDYLVDHDANRGPEARPLEVALKEMGVRSLRFPGGDKSDNYLWCAPPFERPRPMLAGGPRYGREELLVTADGDWTVKLLDFDEFMEMCRRLGAEPTVVVCYDALHHPKCSLTKEQLIETAVAWVRYANVEKQYGVKYWELGNEGYIEKEVDARDYARDVVAFSKAMKAVDPSIKICANGPDSADATGAGEVNRETPWWKEVFETAADYIDCAVVHSYPLHAWRECEYDAYRDRTPEVIQHVNAPIEAAARWGPPELAERLGVVVTEFNSSVGPQGQWKIVNDLGRGLLVCDMVGMLLEQPKVEMAQLWNTRWVSHPTVRWPGMLDPQAPSLWDALDDDNHLRPTGTALSIWSQFVNEQMVQASSAYRIRTFASYSPSSGRLSILLINKDDRVRDVTVGVHGLARLDTASRWAWQGDGPADQRPTWSGPHDLEPDGDEIRLALPADSLTVVEVNP